MMDLKSASDFKVSSADRFGLGASPAQGFNDATAATDAKDSAVPKDSSDGAASAAPSFAEVLGAKKTTNSSALKNLDEALTKDLEELDETISQVGREVAMGNFLNKMKETFQVEPEKLMSAFANLSPQELQRPPEDNVEKIVAQLNLPPEQKSQVIDEFTKVLKVTEGPMAAKSKDPKEVEAVPLALQLQLQSQLQSQLAQQMALLQQPLSGSTLPPLFQSQNAQEIQAQLAALANSADRAAGNKEALGPDPATNRDRSAAFAALYGSQSLSDAAAPMGAATPSATANTAALQQLASVIHAQDEISESDASDASETKGTDKGVGSATATNANPSSVATAAGVTIPEAMLAQAAAANGSAAQGQGLAKNSAYQNEKLKDPSSEAKHEIQSGDPSSESPANPALTTDTSAGQQAQAAAVAPKSAAVAAGGAGAAAITLQGNSTNNANNINEMIRQAQFLARKGGGEMKIQLQPEGLGQVSMHVRVDGGQVSIQMLTQTPDAKKMIEHSLTDLKSSLASHQLDLGAIKVDLARDSGRHLDQHDTSHRQAAQQGWDDFRQSQQQRRETAEASPTQRSVARPRARDFVQPPYMRSQRASADRRLDLVA